MSAAGPDCTATPPPAQGRWDKPANRPQARMNADAGRRKSAGTTQGQCRDNAGTISLSVGSPPRCRPACPDPAPLEPGHPATADCSPAGLAPGLPPGESFPATAAGAKDTPAAALPGPKAPALVRDRAHSVTRHGRAWAVHDPAGELVALTLYRKGAAEVVRRLEAVRQAGPTKGASA